MQLTLLDLENKIKSIKKITKNYKNIKVYIGDDDELNGIHCCWYIDNFNKGSLDTNEKSIIELLEETNDKLEENETIVLIS
jgi:hypothetical protein